MSFDPLRERDILSAQDLGRLLMAGVGGGAAARAIAGILNKATPSPVKEEERPPELRVVMPVVKRTKRSALTTRPWWYYPSAVVGAPLAALGGWAAVSSLIKRRRRADRAEELEAAKREFEDALSDEQRLKFSSSLHGMAEAYVKRGSTSVLEALIGAAKAIPPVVYTTAGLSGVVGLPLGWSVLGQSDEENRVRAYREAMRRRDIAKPVTVSLRASRTPDLAEGQRHDEESENKSAAVGSTTGRLAQWWMRAKPVMKTYARPLGAGAAAGGLTAAGLGLLAANTGLGSSMALNIAPQLIDKSIERLQNDPAAARRIFERVRPMIRQQLVESHPYIGPFLQYLV